MTIRRRPYRAVFIVCSVLWMILIFSMSAVPGQETLRTSGRLVTFVQKVFYKKWEALPEAEFTAYLGRLNYFLRKAAHMMEFAVLGALFSLVSATFQKRFSFRAAVSFLCGVLYAASDEIHQHFVPGRDGIVFDVLVDSAGVFIGVVTVLGILAMIGEDRKTGGTAAALPQ